MKNFLKSIRFVLATLLLIIASQISLLAESNSNQTESAGLSAGQIVGGFAVLLFIILLPLVKSRTKAIANK
ncbi:MAG: hypothetical protein ACHQD7_00855 [Chitinophagales bacterium]